MELTEKQKDTILSALKYCYYQERISLSEARRERNSKQETRIERNMSDLQDAVQALGSRV